MESIRSSARDVTRSCRSSGEDALLVLRSRAGSAYGDEISPGYAPVGSSINVNREFQGKVPEYLVCRSTSRWNAKGIFMSSVCWIWLRTVQASVSASSARDTAKTAR